jgi:electron transfer flavoprotein beta subunit
MASLPGSIDAVSPSAGDGGRIRPTASRSRRKAGSEAPDAPWMVSGLGVDVTPRLQVSRVEEPPARQAGIKVDSVQELVKKLHEEAKVI